MTQLPSAFEQTTDIRRSALTRSLREPSTFEQRYPDGVTVIEYTPSAHPLRESVQDMLVDKGFVSAPVALEHLHGHLTAAQKAVDDSQVNAVTAAFYETEPHFRRLYLGFVRAVADQAIGTDAYFQRTPTIRFHFPHADGMDAEDRVHNDLMLGHPPQEVNVWVPLTDAARSRSFALCSLADTMRVLERFDHDVVTMQRAMSTDATLRRELRMLCQPVLLAPGQAVLFDSRCLHTARRNTSDVTRVSIDFRVVPIDDLARMPYEFRGTGRRKAAFLPGDYYDASPIGSLT